MDLEKASLHVCGLAHQKILKQLKDILDYDANDEAAIIVFCTFSGFDIPIGYTFSKILNNNNEIVFSGNFVLEGVSQQFFKPFDEVPHGWKTICKFRFINSTVPKIIRRLPSINGWYDADPTLIFSN